MRKEETMEEVRRRAERRQGGGRGRGRFCAKGEEKKSNNQPKEHTPVFYKESFDKVQELSVFEKCATLCSI